MWNSKMQEPIDDDSWEVRAFAEDTNHAMGTTWPPRSYTCTFCRREFKSAQALGGHMNVHRRDRAQLHHTQPKSNIPTHQDLVASGGLCLLYSLQNPNPNPKGDSPSPFLSISPYNFIDFPAVSSGIDASKCHKELPSGSMCEKDPINLNGNYGSDRPAMEELDLELRLGPSSSVPS